MARIVCLSDTLSLVRAIRRELAGGEHSIHLLPCSRLNDALRQAVRQAAPDIVLLELTHTLDNPHIYFFLRADQATRHVPVVLLSSMPHIELYADALGADGFVHTPLNEAELHVVLDTCLGVRRSFPPHQVPARRRAVSVARRMVARYPVITLPVNT
ncbi:MAG: response regulator [Chloroflexi bacterium]|nr:response regulator [Chloroflexota bacterium]